jgi:tetratricopeptide (TPR) repeat protein
LKKLWRIISCAGWQDSMKAPLHQRVIEITQYILAGIVAVGAVLDSFANAISLLTPLMAGIGTAFILLGWLLTSIILRFHPLSWVEANQEVPLRKLGIKPTAFMVSLVLLLWIPSLLTPFQNKNSLPTASPPNTTATEHSIAAGGDITVTAQPGGTAIVTTGNVILDPKAIAESLVKAHERELAGFREREQAYQDQVKALTNAVTALAQQQRQPNTPPGIEDALAQLQQGHTAAAETIFETVLARKAAEGQAANQQAAAAARHLGALASLHDTAKALTAYRRAVALDPANAEGWNGLGHLLYRSGHRDEAIATYNHVRALGTISGDQSILAIAYGNLGVMYRSRGDLRQAEAMYHKALELSGSLDYKESTAITYLNLGLIYEGWGNLTQAETMYHQALTRFQELGATSGIEAVRTSLERVRMQCLPFGFSLHLRW